MTESYPYARIVADFDFELWWLKTSTFPTKEKETEMANERIRLEMTVQEMLMAMGGGNPGALTVCMELLKKGEKIDPDAFNGGFASLLDLDTLGIYEHRIWGLYKDVCGCHVGKTIAVLRAHQLGQLAGVDTKTLNHAIDNRGAGIDLDAVVEAVKSRLPNFNPEAVAA
ncbi:MAG: hypothetical protein WC798_00755 [Candidatus Paceibacterota bacterium]